MPFQHYENNARGTLSVAVSSTSQATLTLQTGEGARFPSPLNPDFVLVTIDDGTNIEICKCIARSGDVLTVLRGQEHTTAQASFATGARVEARLTGGTVERWPVRWSFDMKWIRPTANVASWHVLGVTLPTVVNSQIAGTLTNSSAREQNERIRHVCANSAQNPISKRLAQPTVSGQNGYRYAFRFGFAIVPNSSHWFYGLVNTTGAVTSVHPPSSLINAIAIGYDNGTLGSQLSVYNNDASGAAVKNALNSYFTVTTQGWYEFGIEADPSGSAIEYYVKRLDISSIPDFVGSLTADLPANSLWLSPYFHGSTMVTSGIAVEDGGMVWRS